MAGADGRRRAPGPRESRLEGLRGRVYMRTAWARGRVSGSTSSVPRAAVSTSRVSMNGKTALRGRMKGGQRGDNRGVVLHAT